MLERLNSQPPILLTPFGSAGDVFPFIWLGRRLRARGHRVILLTACLFEEAATKAGLEFVGLGAREEFESLQRDSRLWKPYQATKLVFSYAGRWASRFHEAICRLAEEIKPSLMLSPLLAFGSRMARESLGVPLITVHLQPAVLISMHDTPVLLSGLPWISKLPRWLKRLIFSLPNPVDRFALPEVRRSCERAGIIPPRSLFHEWWDSPDGVLMLWPEWFAGPQPDWPANFFQHTFPLEDLAAEQPLSAELAAFLAAGGPPVVFTPGSANVQAHRFFRAALGAVEKLGARAVFVTRDLSQLPPNLPRSVLAAEYAPFSQLVRHASVFAHHGGIGTLSQGLAAGVPQLLMPMAHDQPDNEHRLRRLGAGFGIVPGQFTADRVAAALQKLMTDPAIRSAAARCAERVRGSPPADEMLAWIERRL